MKLKKKETLLQKNQIKTKQIKMVLLGCAGLLGYGGLAYGYTGLGLGLGNLELFFKYNIQINI